MKNLKKTKETGIVIPLGAIYTKDNNAIGEFPDLIPFADFCKSCGIKIIQLLPINDTGTQSSPYSGLSAFALHPVYIRIQDIKGFDEIYKTNKKVKELFDNFISNNKYTLRYDYNNILNAKIEILREIYSTTSIAKNKKADNEMEKWIKENPWISTYAVYKKLKWDYMQSSWKEWKKEDKSKSIEEIEKLWNDKDNAKEHLFYAWVQMIAEEQLSKSVKYLKKNDILLKGDMPILMNEDSCDAWAYPQFFNQNLRAGSPADGENPTGQNWGFPTYNWKNLKAENYSWWKDRLVSASKYYDAYRLDHILGFFRIWAIPAEDTNALNGHTEPYSAIKVNELYELGFDEDRIRWLSQPHVPTGVIEDITWNHEQATSILEIFCDRIGNEELWLFKKSIKGSNIFYEKEKNIAKICDKNAVQPIIEVLTKYWSNRTLLEVGKNKYVPLWTYLKSTSWGSLNEVEKEKLNTLFDKLNSKQEKLWAKQADEIFSAITKDLDMIPCGEDLGVNIPCIPVTMKNHNILGLRVIRWCRDWGSDGMPYEDFENYEPLSVTTTSVHDSSTIRQWWEDEKESVKAFIKANPKAFGLEFTEDLDDNKKNEEIEKLSQTNFTPEIAEIYMTVASSSASYWYISPLQDFLYMNKEYWLTKSEDERINIPGTVTKFNWTYRMPVSVEKLSKDNNLIKKISDIAKRK